MREGMTQHNMTSHVHFDILVGAKHTNRTQGTGIFVVNLNNKISDPKLQKKNTEKQYTMFGKGLKQISCDKPNSAI